MAAREDDAKQDHSSDSGPSDGSQDLREKSVTAIAAMQRNKACTRSPELEYTVEQTKPLQSKERELSV